MTRKKISEAPKIDAIPIERWIKNEIKLETRIMKHHAKEGSYGAAYDYQQTIHTLHMLLDLISAGLIVLEKEKPCVKKSKSHK